MEWSDSRSGGENREKRDAERYDPRAELIKKHVTRLRDMSPLWEMVQEGIDINSIQWAAH